MLAAAFCILLQHFAVPYDLVYRRAQIVTQLRKRVGPGGRMFHGMTDPSAPRNAFPTRNERRASGRRNGSTFIKLSQSIKFSTNGTMRPGHSDYFTPVITGCTHAHSGSPSAIGFSFFFEETTFART